MEAAQDVERRIVTILFADLVGFTTLSEQFDAEDVAAIQDRYFATVRETIGRYGGTLEKFIGDAAMAVFGVPRSRDDDAARAVRAGLALTSAIEQIGAELGLEPDALRLRVGVNTGEAVIAAAGADSGRVTGDTVNTAARLQTAAPPGGVLIGEKTALAVADTAELEAATALELKGKAQPVAARLVSGWRQEPSHDEAMGGLRAPTLGRAAELAQLEAAYERANAGGLERWLIAAPPGVGKSRLLREFAARLERQPGPPLVLRTRSRADTVAPFAAIAVLMGEAIAETDHATARRTLIGSLDAAGVPELRRGIVVEACVAVAWPDASAATDHPQEEREALFGAWLEGIDALAAGRTQVWLVEDVHWAGGDVLAFLERAVAHGPAAPRGGRLVVATTRPSLLEANPDWTADRPQDGHHLLQLSTLAPTDARSLVSALVGDTLPDSLVERITERSDGNPLFIEELLRTWVSVGTLVREGDLWRLTVGADDIPLPTSVQSIYAAQLDDLPPDARNLARRASVAGRRFPVGALQPLGAATETGLAPLQRRELVVGPLDEPVVGTAYSYRHALLRDAGYASLARAERARLHVRLARWLEGAAGDHAAELAEQIAGHYAAALESAPALTHEVEGLEREALRRLAAEWYERAGQGTLALSAHDAARQLLKRSIELTPDDEPLHQARRWERLGDATAFAADMDEGAAAYQKAIDLYRVAAGAAGAEAHGGLARSGLARSTAALSDVLYQQLRFSDARDIADQVLTEVGDEDQVATAHLLTARALGSLGAGGPSAEIERDLVRATELAHAALEPRVELKARSGLMMARSESGHGAMEDWQELSEMAEAIGDWREAVSASTSAIAYMLDDQAADTFAMIERTRDTAASHGLTEETGWLDYRAAEAAFVTGDWARARELGGRAIEIGEANAYLRMTVRTWHVLIPIAGATGDRATLDRAARWYRSLEGKFEFPDSPYARVIRVAQDLEMAAAGVWPEFVPDAEPRIASFNDDPSGPSWSAALDRVFRAWLEAGDIDGAALAFAALDEAVARMGEVTNLGHGTHQLLAGRLALARTDRDGAARAGRTALERFRTANAPWWIAKAVRLLERAGVADDEALIEVREIERRLGSAGPTP